MRVRLRMIVTICWAVIAVYLFPAGVLAASCEDCHSSSNPSGGWRYHPPIISLVHDPFYPADTEFILELVITGASDYDIRGIESTVAEIGTGLELIDGEVGVPLERDNGETILTWKVRALSTGDHTVAVDIDYKVFYEHTVAGSKDKASYFTRVETEIMVADLDLGVTPGTLIFEEVGDVGTLTLTADNNVDDIEVVADNDTSDLVSIFLEKDSLMAGETITVEVRLLEMRDGITSLNISWIENGSAKKIPVEIVISDPGEESEIDILWEVGKYTGIAALVLLLVTYFTGGTSPFKKYANKLFRSAKRRVDFHCNLSYEVMILSFVHLATLFYGPFRELIWQWEVVLGEVAMILMIVVAANGILQKRFIKVMGYQNWRRIHAWGTYLITALVAIHMLLYGSHFLWFRNLIGY